MVAVYCRCFVAAAGAKIAPKETAHAVASLQDYLFSLQEVRHGKMDLYLRTSRLGKAEYLHLQAPAVDWLFAVVGPGAPRVRRVEDRPPPQPRHKRILPPSQRWWCFFPTSHTHRGYIGPHSITKSAYIDGRKFILLSCFRLILEVYI